MRSAGVGRSARLPADSILPAPVACPVLLAQTSPARKVLPCASSGVPAVAGRRPCVPSAPVTRDSRRWAWEASLPARASGFKVEQEASKRQARRLDRWHGERSDLVFRTDDSVALTGVAADVFYGGDDAAAIVPKDATVGPSPF